MLDPHEFLTLAQELATKQHPTDAELRRAISTAYYALLHHLTSKATARLVGTIGTAFELFYRDFNNHKVVLGVCIDLDKIKLDDQLARVVGFDRPPQELRVFCNAFVQLQKARHDGDYHPLKPHHHASTLAFVDLTDKAISAFDRLTNSVQGAVFMLIIKRNGNLSSK